MKTKIEPTGLYRAISSFAQLTERGHLLVRAGETLAGTNSLVLNHPDRFVLASTPSDEEERIRRDRLAARDAAQPPEPPRSTIIGPIPLERRMRAVKHYHGRDGVMVDIGAIYDARDEFVQANPALFEPAV